MNIILLGIALYLPALFFIYLSARLISFAIYKSRSQFYATALQEGGNAIEE